MRKRSLGSWNLCARESKSLEVPRKEVETMMPGSAMSASDENGAGLVGDNGRPSSQSAACKRLRPKACVTPAGADRGRPGIQHLHQGAQLSPTRVARGLQSNSRFSPQPVSGPLNFPFHTNARRTRSCAMHDQTSGSCGLGALHLPHPRRRTMSRTADLS